jgi:acyl dehydratase
MISAIATPVLRVAYTKDKWAFYLIIPLNRCLSAIAHGYLSLSLVAPLAMEMGLAPKDASAVFNYGLDKVRFVTPVRCGDRVRLQLALASVEPKDDGQFLIKGKATLEIENNPSPALVAETLALIVP